MDGINTRIGSMMTPFVSNLLEQQLGAVEAGTFRQAWNKENFAYEKVHDLLGIELDPAETANEEEESKGEDTTGTEEVTDNQQAQPLGNCQRAEVIAIEATSNQKG
eukprot:3025531-Ditylum_brightwellii.AAC.1